MSPGPDELSDLARRYTASWCSGDPTCVAQITTRRKGRSRSTTAPPALGRKVITGATEGFTVGFPDLRVEMDELRLDGAPAEYVSRRQSAQH